MSTNSKEQVIRMIRKFGNSTYINIPVRLLRSLKIQTPQEVIITVEDGKIVVQVLRLPVVSLPHKFRVLNTRPE